MCTFLSSLPTKSFSAGTNKRSNLVLSIKPCPDTPTEKTWYRFRLLAFNAPTKSTRDFPFIERYVHQKWGKNDKGYFVIEDEVVCPVTRWTEFEGNRYESCPICKVANQYFTVYKESNWKDREAWKKQNEISRKYQAIIPVYVVNDPNYPANNHKLKVIIFNDKKFYQDFLDKIKKTSTTNNVFNVNAVDCCIHMSEVDEIVNKGQPNEYIWHKREIDKITFSKKPYDIPSITKENVDNMEFDETYYVSSTMEELQSFYNRNIKVSNDDIPDDDISNDVYEDENENIKKVKKTNKVVETKLENKTIENNLKTETEDISDEDLNDLLDDPDNLSLENFDESKNEQQNKKESQTELINSLDEKSVSSSSDENLDDLGIDDILKDLDVE